MRISILVSTLVFVAGCSSAAKNDTPAPVQPAQTTSTTGTTQPAGDKGSLFPTPTPQTMKLACSHGADSRVLELREKNKGCELGYTKSGKEAVIATSASGNSHCEKAMNRIKEKLAGSGFTCQ